MKTEEKIGDECERIQENIARINNTVKDILADILLEEKRRKRHMFYMCLFTGFNIGLWWFFHR